MSKNTTTFIIVIIVVAVAGLYGIMSGDKTVNGNDPAKQVQSISYTEENIVDQDGEVLIDERDVPQSMAVSEGSEFGAAGAFTSAELSPDGGWIAFTTTGAAHGGGWLYEVETGEVSAAVFQYGGDVQTLEWSPNAQYALFSVSTPIPSEQLVLVDRHNLSKYVEDTSVPVLVSEAEGMNSSASYTFERWEAPHTLCFSVLDSEYCLDALDVVTQAEEEAGLEE